MDYAQIIKEVGRGKNHARDISLEQAEALFDAMLAGKIPELELGGILIGLRIKGEAEQEMLGFYRSMQKWAPKLELPKGMPMPVVIPSYNGARKQANLTPLLAMLLAREGVPVLVHGVSEDPSRVTSAEIFRGLGITATQNLQNIDWHTGKPIFIGVEHLFPEMYQILSLRWRMGVRNSAHTLIKMINPFAGDVLRIASVSHPEYIQRMSGLFNQTNSTALLLHGTEGEAYANPLRCPQMHLCRNGNISTVVTREMGEGDAPELAEAKSIESTVNWTQRCLRGEITVPRSIQLQVEACLRVISVS
ncbi:DNA-binding protein YbiB [Hafnia paralvei]|uniref:DNA-binding protein YbiB n=1 Tax=Hafnia paralvei TaxID=546367 RepID=UPI001034275C|nr:DNA-binding protein YbiB [Hafnia paralvei]TBM29389.1 DNA-binding protein YbiB [Hafnia paralvei]